MINKTKLKNYEVEIHEENYGYIRVKAHTQKEAKEKAEEGWHNGSAFLGGDSDLIIGDVILLKNNGDFK